MAKISQLSQLTSDELDSLPNRVMIPVNVPTNGEPNGALVTRTVSAFQVINAVLSAGVVHNIIANNSLSSRNSVFSNKLYINDSSPIGEHKLEIGANIGSLHYMLSAKSSNENNKTFLWDYAQNSTGYGGYKRITSHVGRGAVFESETANGNMSMFHFNSTTYNAMFFRAVVPTGLEYFNATGTTLVSILSSPIMPLGAMTIGQTGGAAGAAVALTVGGSISAGESVYAGGTIETEGTGNSTQWNNSKTILAANSAAWDIVKNAGNDKEVIFNNSDTLSGNASLTYNTDGTLVMYPREAKAPAINFVNTNALGSLLSRNSFGGDDGTHSFILSSARSDGSSQLYLSDRSGNFLGGLRRNATGTNGLYIISQTQAGVGMMYYTSALSNYNRISFYLGEKDNSKGYDILGGKTVLTILSSSDYTDGAVTIGAGVGNPSATLTVGGSISARGTITIEPRAANQHETAGVSAMRVPAINFTTQNVIGDKFAFDIGIEPKGAGTAHYILSGFSNTTPGFSEFYIYDITTGSQGYGGIRRNFDASFGLAWSSQNSIGVREILHAGNAFYFSASEKDDAKKASTGTTIMYLVSSVSFPDGALSIADGSKTPSAELTVGGSISARGTIYDSTGNSNQWNSSKTTVAANSATWGSGSVAGNDREIIFNNSDTLSGNASLTYNTDGTLTFQRFKASAQNVINFKSFNGIGAVITETGIGGFDGTNHFTLSSIRANGTAQMYISELAADGQHGGIRRNVTSNSAGLYIGSQTGVGAAGTVHQTGLGSYNRYAFFLGEKDNNKGYNVLNPKTVLTILSSSDYTDGAVTIGHATTAPEATLHVAGTIKATAPAALAHEFIGSIHTGEASNTATGSGSFVGGTGSGSGFNHATGHTSFAFGQGNTTAGNVGFSIGSLNRSSGSISYTRGQLCKAEGHLTHAIGYQSKAINQGGMAIGVNATAINVNDMIVNLGNTPLSSNQSITSPAFSLSAKRVNIGGIVGIGNFESYEDGYRPADLDSNYALTVGGSISARDEIKAYAPGSEWHIFEGSSIHGQSTNTASGSCAHAEGHNCTASGDFSHAEGHNCTASGAQSHAEGQGNWALGLQSHAQNQGNIAKGNLSHAQGFQCFANGTGSFAGGSDAHAHGQYSFIWNSGSASLSTGFGGSVIALSGNNIFLSRTAINTYRSNEDGYEAPNVQYPDALTVNGSISAAGEIKAKMNLNTGNAAGFTFAYDNHCQVIELSGAGNIILPKGFDRGTQVAFVNVGTGILTLSAVTLKSKSRNGIQMTKMVEQYSAVTCYYDDNRLTWTAFGDLSAGGI